MPASNSLTRPDRQDGRVGVVVDHRYQILELMAKGSHGAVYKAQRVPIDKLVAIKFLHDSFANDSNFLARFERETRAMSKLAHPNCVSVVDFGVWTGAPYLVMDYVAGRTLRKIIRDEGALPTVRALAIARQILAGLAHAHARGITHRDVKPSNTMISEEIGTGEHVRIVDFGIARLRGAGGRDTTPPNALVGTANYMAPEQTVGGIIDARTDIYAVGVVLFEMIAGELPFLAEAEETFVLLEMHRAAPVPKLADRVRKKGELSAELQELIEKAMAKAPGDRFQSAIEFADAIDGLLGRTKLETNPKGHPVVRQDTVVTVPMPLASSSRDETTTVVDCSSRTVVDRSNTTATVVDRSSTTASTTAVVDRSSTTPLRGNRRI